MNINDLKSKINEIVIKNPVDKEKASTIDKASREISFIESELRDNKVFIDHKMSLPELTNLAPDHQISKFGYIANDYSISWEKVSDNFMFVISNIKVNLRVPLGKCPLEIKNKVYKSLDKFVLILSQKAKDEYEKILSNPRNFE